MKKLALLLSAIISIEFIDSRDDQSKTFLKACDVKSCVWLMLDKKELTSKSGRVKIVNVMDKLIQDKERE